MTNFYHINGPFQGRIDEGITERAVDFAATELKLDKKQVRRFEAIINELVLNHFCYDPDDQELGKESSITVYERSPNIVVESTGYIHAKQFEELETKINRTQSLPSPELKRLYLLWGNLPIDAPIPEEYGPTSTSKGAGGGYFLVALIAGNPLTIERINGSETAGELFKFRVTIPFRRKMDLRLLRGISTFDEERSR